MHWYERTEYILTWNLHNIIVKTFHLHPLFPYLTIPILITIKHSYECEYIYTRPNVHKCRPSSGCGVSHDKLLGGVIGTMLSDLKRSWGFENGIYIWTFDTRTRSITNISHTEMEQQKLNVYWMLHAQNVESFCITIYSFETFFFLLEIISMSVSDNINIVRKRHNHFSGCE